MVSRSTLLPRLPLLFRGPLLAILLSAATLHSFGGQAERKIHHGVHFWAYEYEPTKEILRLHLPEKAGEPNLFPAVAEKLAAKGEKLLFATNSGIFEGNFRPTGLHISEGKTITPLNLETFVKEREGQFTPNFFLKPNGVFSIDRDGKASILESSRFAAAEIDAETATQSGPLLVARGRIHPVLTPDSTSTRYRNGVGVREDGTVIFACSVLEPDIGMSNLYRFAEFFRDQLRCPDVLYLDGDISYIFIEGKTPPIEKTNFFAGIFTITPRPPLQP